MGAGPLSSVTLPVWAQPWYALHELGVGPKFEPNKFGGVGCGGKKYDLTYRQPKSEVAVEQKVPPRIRVCKV